MANVLLRIEQLGFPWVTADPFLFCVHHDDAYPHGNDVMGPDASLAGRNIGMDFEGRDGWRMYHGDTVPGFPQHPHRGFETVTLARRGFIDHSDSLGATARFGKGDAQWMTAGSGVVHSEMFPLLEKDRDNPLELFQIWLNLPRKSKMVEPHFKMLWSEEIPTVVHKDDAGKETSVTLVAGELDGKRAPAPPPRSWAAHDESDLGIWTIRMEAGATWTVPPARKGTGRVLYFFVGRDLKVDDENVPPRRALFVRADAEAKLEVGDEPAELLLLQGRPIGEPVAHYGPFVMNEPQEIQQAMMDYRRTQFGGWPWPSDSPVHPRGAGRFAKHADGKVEKLS